MYSLANEFGFSIDTPGTAARLGADVILYGIEKKIAITMPPDAKEDARDWEGHEVGFGGIARRIERHIARSPERPGEFRHGSMARQSHVEHTA